jgi:hypothetical protein
MPTNLNENQRISYIFLLLDQCLLKQHNPLILPHGFLLCQRQINLHSTLLLNDLLIHSIHLIQVLLQLLRLLLVLLVISAQIALKLPISILDFIQLHLQLKHLLDSILQIPDRLLPLMLIPIRHLIHPLLR